MQSATHQDLYICLVLPVSKLAVPQDGMLTVSCRITLYSVFQSVIAKPLFLTVDNFSNAPEEMVFFLNAVRKGQGNADFFALPKVRIAIFRSLGNALLQAKGYGEKCMLAQAVTSLGSLVLPGVADVLASSGMSRYYLALSRHILSATCCTMDAEFVSDHVTSMSGRQPSVSELLRTDTQPPSFLLPQPDHLNHCKMCVGQC